MPATTLDHFVKIYDGNLDAALCQRMIESFATLSQFQLRNGADVRAGLDQSAWTELNVTRLSDDKFRTAFRNTIETAFSAYNRDIGLSMALPNSAKISDLIMKKYSPGGAERFQLHFDSIYDRSNRYLVFLWYLNDVAEGGQTFFPDLQQEVAAKQGRLLMFPPYWMYQHEGRPPISGDKYILSTYLLF